jgi:predicted metal-dependent phosphoesterase TrpH
MAMDQVQTTSLPTVGEISAATDLASVQKLLVRVETFKAQQSALEAEHMGKAAESTNHLAQTESKNWDRNSMCTLLAACIAARKQNMTTVTKEPTLNDVIDDSLYMLDRALAGIDSRMSKR